MNNPVTIRPVHEAFSRRCAQLGIAVFLCDASGKVVAQQQSGADSIDPVKLSELVTEVISDHSGSKEPIALEDGRHLLLLEEKLGTQMLSISAAILPGIGSIEQITKMLRWMFDDLLRASRDERTIGQFSDRLAQTYEENNVLMNLSQALNRDVAPLETIRMICEQLHDTLPFAWLAIRFTAADLQVPELAERLVMCGTPPCDLHELDQAIVSMLVSGTSDLQIHARGSSHISTLVDSEIIAEPIVHDGHVIGLLLAGNKGGDDPGVLSAETQFISAAGGFMSILHENISRFAEQETQFLGTLRALTAAIDAKDHYTRGHSERVAQLASSMAEAMHLGSKMSEQFHIAGMVHDVGKIGVPEAILCKPGRPTDEEFDRIRMHPQIGYDILRDIPKLARALPAVLHHHERWDGRGYPHGLAAEDIPLIARVMALADAFDAMSTNRSYRAALSREEVLAEFHHCSGSQFDPALVPTFLRLDFTIFDALVDRHRASERFAA